jgi:Icc-related predicted phosphoesterase
LIRKRSEGPMATTERRVRVAAVADVHCTKTSQGVFQPLFAQVNERADVLVLCGDLTDHGLPEEAQVLTRDLTAAVKLPVVAVLGNHDCHSGKEEELEKILTAAGVHVLDGDEYEVHGVGFAGVKGFGGGFDRHTLEPWGEEGVKRFVYESVEEALKLEKALARLHAARRIAVLHYAPIQATVEGEPAAIFPFLGSSRLEEPINRYEVTAVLHGHSHHGRPEGRTKAGVPVYNVSLPVLREAYPDRPPFRVLEFAVPDSAGGAAGPDGGADGSDQAAPPTPRPSAASSRTGPSTRGGSPARAPRSG